MDKINLWINKQLLKIHFVTTTEIKKEKMARTPETPHISPQSQYPPPHRGLAYMEIRSLLLYKWTHIVCALVCRVSFAQFYACEIHPWCV